jgi:alkylation response protein AidB-like acyl-CoA dehydrogenase
VLRLSQVPIDPGSDLIGERGTGLTVFREHFTRFRPLVAATAIGAAASTSSHVAQTLSARVRIGVLPAVRDNALISLGHTHARLTAALQSCLAATAPSRQRRPGRRHAGQGREGLRGR